MRGTMRWRGALGVLVSTIASGCNAIVGIGELRLGSDAGADAAPDAAPAVLTILGEPLTFPAPVLLGQPATMMVRIQNESTAPLAGITFSDDSAETTTTHFCGMTLAPQEICDATVVLTPTSLGAKSVTLTVAADGGAMDTAVVSTTAQAMVSVTIATVGGTTGRVTSMPAGLDCQTGTCQALFAASPVRLTAVDDANGTLADWSVAGCTTDLPCDLVVGSAQVSATATFQAPWTYLAADAVQNQFEGVDIDPTNGSAIAVGSSSSAARAVRLNGASGARLDSAELSAGAPRTFREVSVAASGSIAVSGEQTGAGYDPALDFLDANLDRVGGATVAGNGNEFGWGLGRNAGGLLWIGSYGTTNTFVNRYDSAGNPLTLQARSFSVPYFGHDVAFAPNGTMWAIAGSASFGWVGTFTDAGNGEATIGVSQTLSGRGFNRLIIDGTGNLVIAGWMNSPDRDFAVWKLAPNFTLLWTRQLMVSGLDLALGVAFDPRGNIIATGDSGGACVVVKLRASDGVEFFRRSIANTSCAAVAADATGVVVVGFQNDAAVSRQSFARKYFH